MNPLAAIGTFVLTMLAETGRIALFAVQATFRIVLPPFYVSTFIRAVGRIGFLSLPVVGLTALFTGGALALNIYTGGTRFNAEQFVPEIVAVGITRELGPVLASLMLAGRVAAAIAAEVGTMRVTEQIDALRTMGVDPVRYLVSPRILAGILMLPLVVLIADIIGVMGGYLVAVQALDFSGPTYLRNTWNFLTAWDVVSGLIKAAVFGFIITVMGSYHGYNSRGGAQGVGRATTNAVVASAILIFAANYLLTAFFTADE